MFLGYYKHKIKDGAMQIWRRFYYRFKNNVQKGVYFGKNTFLSGNAYIGDNTVLEMNIVVGRNARIGNNARLSNISIGENSQVESNVICTGFGAGKISIGKESYVGIGCILDWSANITIGNYVHTCGHLFTHSSVKQVLAGDALGDKKNRNSAPIVIEDNVYIGYGSIVYPGVTIHQHCVVLPNSVVDRDVPAYSMVGGAPFQLIKNITEK